MMNSEASQTLEQQLAAGRLAPAEALRIAGQLAEQLRLLHDQGHIHGALTPSTIWIGPVVQVQASGTLAVTPYTAPELLEGWPADARTDIFSFGAIFYEMLTGLRAFDAPDAHALAAELAGAMPRPSGSPAIDRLVAGCVAKSPDARFQNVQKLQLELKMLMKAALRGAPAPGTSEASQLSDAPPCDSASVATASPLALSPYFPRPEPAALPDPAMSGQMQEMESRLAQRLEQQERAVSSLERVANEMLKALRAQPAASYGRSASRGSFSDAFEGDIPSRGERTLDVLYDKLARIDLVLGTAVDRIQKLEESLEAFDTDAAALRDSVTRDIRNFERSLKQHGTAIESARTAMGQTDDLVERVVEAIDSLQSMFITPSEARTAAAS